MRERVMKAGVLKQRRNTSNEPRGPVWTQSAIFTAHIHKPALKLISAWGSWKGEFHHHPHNHPPPSGGAAPRCVKAGNVGCPPRSISCGRQSGSTRPRWMSRQHLLHLLAGSYQQKCCHTHWTGEDGEKKAFFAEFKKTCLLLFVL